VVPPKELTESLKPTGFFTKASLEKGSGSEDVPSVPKQGSFSNNDSKSDDRLPLMPKPRPPSLPSSNKRKSNLFKFNAGKKRKLPPCPNLPRMKRRVVDEEEKKSGVQPKMIPKSKISIKSGDLEGSNKPTSLEVSPPPRMNWDSETLVLADPSVKADKIANIQEAKAQISSPQRLKRCTPPPADDDSTDNPRREEKTSSCERSSKENNTPPPSDDDSLDDQPLGNQILNNKPEKSIRPKEKNPSPARDEGYMNSHNPFKPLNPDGFQEKSDEEDNSNIWSCEVCTYHNPLDASQCGICGCEAGSSVESIRQPLSMAGMPGVTPRGPTPGGPSPDPPQLAQVKPKSKKNSKFLAKLISPPTSRHKTKCSAQLPVPFKSPLSIPVNKIFYDKTENVPRPVRQTVRNSVNQNRRSGQQSQRSAKELELQWELNKVKQEYKGLFEKLGSVVKCKKAAEKDYNRNFGYAEDVRKACNELELQLKVKQKQLQKKLEIVKMSKEFFDESEVKVRESNRKVDAAQQKMNDLEKRIKVLRAMPSQAVAPQKPPSSILSGSVDSAAGKTKVKTVSFDLSAEKRNPKTEPPKYSTPNSSFATRPRKSGKLKHSSGGLRNYFRRAPGPPPIPPPPPPLPPGKAIGRPGSSQAGWLHPKRKKRKKKRQLTHTSRMKMEKIRNGAGKTLFKILTVYDLAQRIEESIFNMCNYDVGTYSKRARDIIFNLKRNKELKERMLSGSLPPEILVSMTNDELASKKLKDKRSQVKKYNMTAHLLNPYEREANTSEYKCEKCGSRKCIFKMVQMDRGDEPLEVFVTCINCQNHWKVDQ